MNRDDSETLRFRLEEAVGLDSQYVIQTPYQRLDPLSLATLIGALALAAIVEGLVEGGHDELKKLGKALFVRVRNAVSSARTTGSVDADQSKQFVADGYELLVKLRVPAVKESEAAVVPVLVEIGIPESRATKIAQRVVIAVMEAHGSSDGRK